MGVKISELPETAMLKNDDIIPCVVDKETSKIPYGDLKNQIKKDLGIEELFQSVSDGKKLVASAVTDKGVLTSGDATFEKMAENIKKLGGELPFMVMYHTAYTSVTNFSPYFIVEEGS